MNRALFGSFRFINSPNSSRENQNGGSALFQIWPVGYKSCWHDQISGSVFVSEGGDDGPIFRVRRFSCSAFRIPVGSTVLSRRNPSPCNGKEKVSNICSTSNRINNGTVHGKMLIKWLQHDKLGLDAEFVQEVFEQLPAVRACSGHIFLNKRDQYSGLLSVQSGFLLSKRKNDALDAQEPDGIFFTVKRHRRNFEDSAPMESYPLGKPFSKLPPCLVGDVLQPFLKFTRQLLDKLAQSMGSKEYWKLNVEERTFLFKFLCDETLNSCTLRAEEESRKGKNIVSGSSPNKRPDENYLGKVSKEKNKLSFTKGKSQDPDCPHDLKDISSKFDMQKSLTELVRGIELIGSSGHPSIAPRSLGYFDQTTLRSVSQGMFKSGNKSKDSKNSPSSSRNDRAEGTSKDEFPKNRRKRDDFQIRMHRGSTRGDSRCEMPDMSLRRLSSRESAILSQLDMDAAIPPEGTSVWSSFVKSAGTIFEMV